MPTIGGVTGSWNELTPANSSGVSDGNEYIQSIKTQLRTGLAAEHNWPNASGSGFGYHVYGSARPFYGLQSAVSSSGSDGRLMLTSDTSRLFGSGSQGTTFFGGPTVPLMGEHPGAVPQRHMWVEEFGTVDASAASTTAVTFPNSGFSGRPYTFLTVSGGDNGAPLVGASVATELTYDGTGMSIVAFNFNAQTFAIPSGVTIAWRSIGTRAT